MDKNWKNPVGKTNTEYIDLSNLSAMENQCKGFLFDDSSIRKSFIRKVYLILMAQLLVTLAILAVFVFNDALRGFVVENPVIIWPAFFLLLITMLIMACCDDLRRQTPFNYIFLGIFTVAQSLVLAVVTCRFDSMEILFAVGTTAVVCFALSLYAMQTKYDFTTMGGALLTLLVVLLIFGVFVIFFPVHIMLLLYNSVGVVLFSVYMIYDTQLMMGGHHKYALSPEEYVYAALSLYLNVINIFLHVLSLISGSRS